MKNQTTEWTTRNIPPQEGRLAVITGATGGLGFETALGLAAAGADVILTGRSAAKGQAALDAIRQQVPTATIRYESLDLASLAEVEAFTSRFLKQHGHLDLLINNAGVMVPPTRHETADGFELQLGTNYLSHFALTARLLPALRAARQPRVVNLSSHTHKMMAVIRFDDLQWRRGYSPARAYSQSKLAMLMFALELQRRSDAHGWGLMSNAAHPGYARTGLQTGGIRLGREDQPPSVGERLMNLLEPWASQSAADGALPTLFAATSPDAKRAGYYGPRNFFGLKGPVCEASIGKRARDTASAVRLWEVSEQLTGVVWAG